MSCFAWDTVSPMHKPSLFQSTAPCYILHPKGKLKTDFRLVRWEFHSFHDEWQNREIKFNGAHCDKTLGDFQQVRPLLD